MLEKNPESVKIVFKHLPLGMHKMARSASLSAIAAQQQGKFWQMHDALFATKKLSKTTIDKAAESIGLDMEQFKKDMKSPATGKALNKDMLDARKSEISGTPTLFVNGRRVKKRGVEAIQKMVEEELVPDDKNRAEPVIEDKPVQEDKPKPTS